MDNLKHLYNIPGNGKDPETNSDFSRDLSHRITFHKLALSAVAGSTCCLMSDTLMGKRQWRKLRKSPRHWRGTQAECDADTPRRGRQEGRSIYSFTQQTFLEYSCGEHMSIRNTLMNKTVKVLTLISCHSTRRKQAWSSKLTKIM